MRAAHRATPGERQPAHVPAVLPQVLATIDHTGRAQVSVDGISRPHGRVGRDQLGSLFASVAEQAGGPVRVEIREADGTRYADILQPQPTRPDDPPAVRENSSSPPRQAALRGEGFLPGEPVLVAVIAATVVAGADGTVELPAAPPVPRTAGELILFGASSATMVRGTAPAGPARRRR